MHTSQGVSSPTIVRCKQSRVVRQRNGVVTASKETCLPSRTDTIEKAQISLGDVRMSCDRIYSKAPTLKTGWGFFLLLIVTCEKNKVSFSTSARLPEPNGAGH